MNNPDKYRTMRIPRSFMQVDVFSPIPTSGNALAVVLDGEGLDDEQMQAFARWTNLAETTFIMPPGNELADYTLRIFTPVREMRFAGHPTLGSCAAWLRAGGIPRQAGTVVQECSVGLVDIKLHDEYNAFIAPPTKIQELPAADAQHLGSALGLPANEILRTVKLDNGPVWQVFQLQSAASVMAVDASRVSWPTHQPIGLIGAHSSSSECDFEVRMLAPSSGMSEDPITGSLNAALAHWLQSNGELDKDLTIAQGTCIGRHGRVYISVSEDDQVLIGGECHVLVEGQVLL